MIQPPSLGDICPDRNVVVVVNTTFRRILLLPKFDDESTLHLLKLSGSACWQSRQVANARKLEGKVPYLI
jgi:hypothetical protein